MRCGSSQQKPLYASTKTVDLIWSVEHEPENLLEGSLLFRETGIPECATEATCFMEESKLYKGNVKGRNDRGIGYLNMF
jgi:hypothetical protein